MSSRRASSSSSSNKGKAVVDSFEQLSNSVEGLSIESSQDDGKWEEVITKKSKNRAGNNAAKQWPSQNNNSNAWIKKPAIGGNSRHLSSTPQPYHKASQPQPQPAIAPPLQHGWNWQSRPANQQPADTTPVTNPSDDEDDNKDETYDDDDESEDMEDFSDDDEFDSDSSEKSHETLKKMKWFAKFFKIIDELKVNEINDPDRQWHCPACQGGPGSIDWYRGLQPLMTHAKTKGGDKMKLHRKFAEILEVELRNKGTSVVPPGETFGKWKGLQDEEKDHEIVWPPMVLVMNTKLEQDDNDKWIGMGNQELLEYFNSYHPAKARHAYGPQGHRGMSVLIFESSARGYLEAERLHKHFVGHGSDRDAWNRRNRTLFLPGGKRRLYGFLAVKEDLDVFNQHSQGKAKLKHEMRSYHETVVTEIRQMSEDNQQLGYYKDKYSREQRHAKALKESFDVVSNKLRKTIAESRIVRHRTKMQQDENKEEMILQEEFFKDQLKIIHDSRDVKEENFERLQQEEREKVKVSKSKAKTSNNAVETGAEEISKFVELQEKEMEQYVEEREKLEKAHEEKIKEMKKRHWEEEVQLEAELNEKLAHLMEKYSPKE
ncbi:protein SUPPRESSOR OF GENE SILENCING 3 [Humulus lupulus]|uniref:protein SUPPRESSOR OF GENE SILENCING 3 n=1 Tax=Humulus lupulus TaxID=3486 RepID=UPI002B40B859|nr:protein SUPPRESSOR OF GENE SILENCING 3 [Humulus lupulus]